MESRRSMTDNTIVAFQRVLVNQVVICNTL